VDGDEEEQKMNEEDENNNIVNFNAGEAVETRDVEI
jgi:hypothetical protein